MAKRIVIVIALGGLLVPGCANPRQTDTPRTGVERLLISTAADRSIEAMDVGPLAGSKVFLDDSRFDGTDKAYAVDAIRDKLGKGGVALVDDKGKAEIVVEIRAGALDIDSSNSFLGLPAIPIIIPGAGTMSTPEVALYKKAKQLGTAKLALHARSLDSGEQVHRTDAKHGLATFTRWTILIWFTFNTTDIPESKKTWY